MAVTGGRTGVSEIQHTMPSRRDPKAVKELAVEQCIQKTSVCSYQEKLFPPPPHLSCTSPQGFYFREKNPTNQQTNPKLMVLYINSQSDELCSLER